MSDGLPVVIGYAWRERLSVTLNNQPAALFPAGCAIKADVRATKESDAVLATLTTGNGGIARVSDSSVDLVLSAAQTAAMAAGHVWLDLVRTDVSPAEYQYITVRLAVVKPITRAA